MKGTGNTKKPGIDFILYLVSTVLLVFIFGAAVGHFKFFPFKLFQLAMDGYQEVRFQSQRFGMASAKQAEEKAEKANSPGFVFKKIPAPYPPPITFTEQAAPGNNLVTRISPDLTLSIDIIDMMGEVLHHWDVNWRDIWPDASHIPAHLKPKTNMGTHVHGAVVTDDGGIIFNFEYLGLVRLDRAGKVVWKLNYRTHHSIHQHNDGNLWVGGIKALGSVDPKYPDRPRNTDKYTLLEISPEGKVLNEWFVSDILHDNAYDGLMYFKTVDKAFVKLVEDDRLHVNDVEPFPDHMVEGYFKKGDVLVSLRNVNTVFVFNKVTGKIKYISTGQFLRQHDPDFIDGNRISVYDNNNKQGAKNVLVNSRILILSPLKNSIEVYYEGSSTAPFYSKFMGKHQWLENGNLLITESIQGRAFEVNKEGQIVWEYVNFVGEGVIALVEEVTRIPANLGGFGK